MNNSKFIFLVGFMGSGKSTIGKVIAKKLGYKFIDTDTLIINKEGKSIPEIFNQYGEKYFRLLEKYRLNEVLKLSGNYVIATGGGMACNQHRLNKMLTNGTVIYLEIDAKSVIQRISQAKEKRPILEGLNPTQLSAKVNSILNFRKKYYEQAHFTVSSLKAKKESWDFLVS